MINNIKHQKMTEKDEYTLYVYEGDYGLVSLDLESIQSILYLTIAKVPMKVELLSNLKKCFKYSAPSLVNKKVVTGFNGILEFMRTKNYNIDQALSSKQCSEMFALRNFVTSKLKPIVDFVYWMDVRNCEEFSYPWYMKALPLPFNYIKTRKEHNRSEQLMESLYPNDTNMNLIKGYMLTSATECLSALSTRLGKSDYFFGNSPTTLDVIVYSFIAPLIKLPFPTKDFGHLFNLWPNLTMFVKRIDSKYLPNVPIEAKYIKADNTIKITSDEEVSYTAIAIIVLSTVTLMFGFAVNKGIIRTNM